MFGSVSKIAQAKRRIEELRDSINNWGSHVSWGIFRQQDPDGLINVLVKITDPFPEEFHHLSAEIAYHLRSSLDQMLVAIASAYGTNDTRNIQFPFMKSETDFNSKKVKGRLTGLPDDVKRLVFETRPWSSGGDQDLWGLGQLANVDKHRTLIPYGAFGGLDYAIGMRVNGALHPRSVGYMPSPGNLLKGVIFSAYGEGGSFEFTGGMPTLNAQIVYAGDVPIFGYTEAVTVNQKLTVLVEGIVKRFSSHSFQA